MAEIDGATFVRKVMEKLDAKDGKVDNKISQDEWNVFADYSGLDTIDDESISMEDAIFETSKVMANNAEKLVNYEGFTGTKHPVLPPEHEEPEEDNSFWGSIKKCFNEVVSCVKDMIDSIVKSLGDMDDAVIDFVIDEAGKDNIVKTVDCATDLTENVLPLSSKLLDLSAHPEKLEEGEYGDYVVLSPEKSEKKLAQMGMHRGDVSLFGSENVHVSDEKMKYNTVVFKEDSVGHDEMSKIIGVLQKVVKWIKEGQPKKKYYSAILNEDMDRKLSVNTCAIAGLNLVDNGDGYTIKGYVEDVYDFDETYAGYGNYIIDRINHAAYKCQQEGMIKPYRVLIPFTINITKEEFNLIK